MIVVSFVVGTEEKVVLRDLRALRGEALCRADHRVGAEKSVPTALFVLGVWGVAALITIIAAVVELRGR